MHRASSNSSADGDYPRPARYSPHWDVDLSAAADDEGLLRDARRFGRNCRLSIHRGSPSAAYSQRAWRDAMRLASPYGLSVCLIPMVSLRQIDCGRLITIELDASHVTDLAYILSRAEWLSRLSIVDCENVTDAVLDAVRPDALARLNYLRIKGTRCTGAGLAHFLRSACHGRPTTHFHLSATLSKGACDLEPVLALFLENERIWDTINLPQLTSDVLERATINFLRDGPGFPMRWRGPEDERVYDDFVLSAHDLTIRSCHVYLANHLAALGHRINQYYIAERAPRIAEAERMAAISAALADQFQLPEDTVPGIVCQYLAHPTGLQPCPYTAALFAYERRMGITYSIGGDGEWVRNTGEPPLIVPELADVADIVPMDE